MVINIYDLSNAPVAGSLPSETKTGLQLRNTNISLLSLINQVIKDTLTAGWWRSHTLYHPPKSCLLILLLSTLVHLPSYHGNPTKRY